MSVSGGEILNETSVTADVYSKEILNPPANGFSLNYDANQGSGNLVCVLKLLSWNGPTVGWVEESLGTFPSQPSGSAMKDTVTFTDTKKKKYKIWADFTSGDGPLRMELGV